MVRCPRRTFNEELKTQIVNLYLDRKIKTALERQGYQVSKRPWLMTLPSAMSSIESSMIAIH